MSNATKCVPSGVPGLDEILGGGIPYGQISLIRGSTGAGKTTLGMQFLLEGARQGESCLYLGTSETEREIQRLAKSHGWSLEGVTLYHFAAEDASVSQTMIEPAEVELPRTMEALLSVVKKHAPQRLVIDSLAEIRVLARSELWYRRQLMILKRFFDENEMTVLIIEIADQGHPALGSLVSCVAEMKQITPAYGPDRRQLRIVKIRGQDFSTGYHDYKIRKGGTRVFPRLTAADYRHRFDHVQLSTGMPVMDQMLHGGYARGTSILLLGASGTGKSAMTSQLAVASAQRGEKAAIFVFDERVQTLFQRAGGIGLPLEQMHNEGMILVRQIDPAELTAGEFSHMVKRLVEEEHIRLLVIDSLNGYAYAMPEEELLSVYLHELSSYLSQQAVTSIFTMTQHGLIFESIQQPFDVSYVADTVLLFRHFECSGRINKAISVYKHRSGPHEATIRELSMGKSGLLIGEPLKRFRGILQGSPLISGDKLDDDENQNTANHR